MSEPPHRRQENPRFDGKAGGEFAFGCEFQPIDHHSVVAVAQGHSFKPTIRVGEALFAAFDRDDAVGQIDAIKPFL
jgi:hypothetical protein